MGHRDNGPMPGTRHQAIMKTFGKRLKTAREKAEPATYRKYERGAAEPNFETLTRLCEHLNVTPDYLLPLAAKAGTSRGEKA
jgi:transcriptional regulator with XRE-family HTH domain